MAVHLDMDDERSPEYAFWASALDGNPLELAKGRAESGFYRYRQRNGDIVPIHIWRHGEQLVVAYNLGVPQIIADEEAWCERVFAYCCKHPVTSESYEHYREHRRWPEDVPVVSMAAFHNSPPNVIIEETKEELRRELERWLAEIGGTVTTQEQADKVGNFADRFAELENDAKREHQAVKKPVLDQAREIDGTWQPLIKGCAQEKVYAKSLLTSYLQAEKARKLAQAAEKAAKGQSVNEKDLKPKAGTRGRSVGLRTRRIAKITDANVFCRALLGVEHQALMEALQRIADGYAELNAPIVGIEIIEEQFAA